jgi:hypothetical protein
LVFSIKRWNTVLFKINTSKLYAVIAVLMIAIGTVVICYSISLFLASPSPTHTTKPLRVAQWSGYIITSDTQNRSQLVSSISASWIVPEVKVTENDTFSAVWIGIGGYGEETLIQTGTEQQCLNGHVSYFAWYELLPNYLVRITDMRIRPGDTITASLSLIDENARTWSIKISDVTQGGRFEEAVFYDSSQLSAEWVAERPTVNGAISTLADFGNVTFSECEATMEGKTGVIGNFSSTQLVMYNSENAQLVTVSPLSDEGSSFTVSYLKSSSSVALSNGLNVFWPVVRARKDLQA